MKNDFFEISKELLQKDLLFTTPFEITSEDQQALLNFVIEHGDELPPEENVTPFWIGAGLTRVSDKRWLEDVKPENQGWWHYLSRLDPRIEWTWNECPESEIVKRVLRPIMPFLKKVTRVTLVVQKVGCALPAHRDLVVGNKYKNMMSAFSTHMGSRVEKFVGKEWFDFSEEHHGSGVHEKQRYLNIKIPISQSQISPGKPFILHEGKKIYYSSENRTFFLNEVDVEHGGDPSDFYRGVVFVDAFFEDHLLSDIPRLPIKIISVENL